MIPPLRMSDGRAVGMTTANIMRLLRSTAARKPNGVSAKMLRRMVRQGGAK
jgi:hypothetical protein